MRNWWILALMCIACERPFVETTKPRLQIVSPDLTQVQTSGLITVRVESSHFRPLAGLSLNGIPMNPAPPGPVFWETSISLRPGLNTLYLDAQDPQGSSKRDTAYAVYLPHRISRNAPPLPQGRGGHTLVRLRDGSLMVTGGVLKRGNLAQGESFLLAANSGQFGQLNEKLLTPRTGHTASVLPDNRVLIVGGSRIDSPTSVRDLIETVEIYDPDGPDRTFRSMPVRGQPIRRVHHTAIIRPANGELLLYLTGGYGDTRYGSNSFLGVRQDMRTFRIESNELVALNSIASAPFIFESVAGHTKTLSSTGSYLLIGARFADERVINANMRVRYSGGTELSFAPLPRLLLPRTDHAATSILNGFIVIFGGKLQNSGITTQMEIFHEQAARFFSLRPSQPMVTRYDHTAISAGYRSVLIVGGFNQNGTAIATSEYLTIDSE